MIPSTPEGDALRTMTMKDYGALSFAERIEIDRWVEDHGVPPGQCFGLEWDDATAVAHLYCLGVDGKFAVVGRGPGAYVASYDVTFGFDVPPPIPVRAA